MLTDTRKMQLGCGIAGLGIIFGFLAIVFEFFNAPLEPTKSIFGFEYTGWSHAEQVFVFLFGAIHLVVAAIITVFRRTAAS